MITTTYINVMRPALLSFFFLLNLKNFSAFAQQKNNSGTLNGRVTDQSTGETLIGVSITASIARIVLQLIIMDISALLFLLIRLLSESPTLVTGQLIH